MDLLKTMLLDNQLWGPLALIGRHVLIDYDSTLL